MSADFARPHADAVSLLTTWRPRGPQQTTWRTEALDLCAGLGPSALDRGASPAHVTASCFVVDDVSGTVLLTRHPVAGHWVQPGGHVEAGDESLSAAAAREVREETGVDARDLVFVGLHRFGRSKAFGTCTLHLDATFTATASAAPPDVTAAGRETPGTAWWPLDDLPPDVVADVPERLAELRNPRRSD